MLVELLKVVLYAVGFVVVVLVASKILDQFHEKQSFRTDVTLFGAIVLVSILGICGVVKLMGVCYTGIQILVSLGS